MVSGARFKGGDLFDANYYFDLISFQSEGTDEYFEKCLSGGVHVWAELEEHGCFSSERRAEFENQ